MVALDTSLLAYAVNRYAPDHPRAARVVEDLVNGETPWALPWTVVHEFVHLVSHPHAVARPLKPSDAWAFIGQVTASSSVRMLGPTERHGDVLVEVLGMVSTEGGIPSGLETAVLLREHGVRELLSADRSLRRFAFLDVWNPLLGEPVSQGTGPPRRRYRTLTPRPARP